MLPLCLYKEPSVALVAIFPDSFCGGNSGFQKHLLPQVPQKRASASAWQSYLNQSFFTFNPIMTENALILRNIFCFKGSFLGAYCKKTSHTASMLTQKCQFASKKPGWLCGWGGRSVCCLWGQAIRAHVDTIKGAK